MSTVFPEAPQASPHLESLQQQMRLVPEHGGSLVIAHDDSEMIEQLRDVLIMDGVVVFPLSQQEWASCLPELIAWTADAGMNQVVLVGHSHGSRPSEESNNRQSDPNRGAVFGDALLKRTQENAREIRHSRRDFVRHVSNLLSALENSQKRWSDSLELHALFFIAESCAFVRYDVTDQTFQPIG